MLNKNNIISVGVHTHTHTHTSVSYIQRGGSLLFKQTLPTSKKGGYSLGGGLTWVNQLD